MKMKSQDSTESSTYCVSYTLLPYHICLWDTLWKAPRIEDSPESKKTEVTEEKRNKFIIWRSYYFHIEVEMLPGLFFSLKTKECVGDQAEEARSEWQQLGQVKFHHASDPIQQLQEFWVAFGDPFACKRELHCGRWTRGLQINNIFISLKLHSLTKVFVTDWPWATRGRW